MTMNNCIECGKEIPNEWGESACSSECYQEHQKKTVKIIVLSSDKLREMWEQDSKVPHTCKHCQFIGSDDDGSEYCSNSWPICLKFDSLGEYMNVEYEGDVFPYKKPRRCFQLNFFESCFADLIGDVEFNNKRVAEYFWSNPSFRENEHTYFKEVLNRLIACDSEIEELRKHVRDLEQKGVKP